MEKVLEGSGERLDLLGSVVDGMEDCLSTVDEILRERDTRFVRCDGNNRYSLCNIASQYRSCNAMDETNYDVISVVRCHK